MFKDHLIFLCDFGFPLTELDLRYTITAYLDKKGQKVPIFKNNLTGYEWAKGFMKRHKDLSSRVSKNIKKVRAQVNEEDINAYMDNLTLEVENLSPSQIWNYDEVIWDKTGYL